MQRRQVEGSAGAHCKTGVAAVHEKHAGPQKAAQVGAEETKRDVQRGKRQEYRQEYRQKLRLLAQSVRDQAVWRRQSRGDERVTGGRKEDYFRGEKEGFPDSGGGGVPAHGRGGGGKMAKRKGFQIAVEEAYLRMDAAAVRWRKGRVSR